MRPKDSKQSEILKVLIASRTFYSHAPPSDTPRPWITSQIAYLGLVSNPTAHYHSK